MPEILEVIHHSESLSNLFKGSNLENIVIRQGPYLTSEKEKYSKFREFVSDYKSHKVKDIKTKGKYMYFLFEGEVHYALGIHHGMEGSWCDDPENKHIILEFQFSECENNSHIYKNNSDKCEIEFQEVYFQDSRRFGTFEFLSEDELLLKLKKIGPDVFYEIETYPEFLSLVTSTKKIRDKRLCEVLMDQTFISGIGNYLRADIMYESKIDPCKLMKDISGSEIESLFSAIKKIVKISYESKATTTGNYKSSIHSGSYEFLIYGKKESPDGGQVESFKDKQKRTVWYVPTSQK